MGKLNESKVKKERKYTDAKATAVRQSSGFQVSSLKLPKGVNSFYFKKEGNYTIDVLPYTVGKHNPMADESYEHYERTYFVHRGVGAENKQYCCLLKNWGENCPICEYRDELKRRGASDDVVNGYYPKKRQIMAVIDLDDKDKGIQIFEGPYAFGLGQLIDNKLDAAKEGSPKTRFYHAEGGQTLTVTCKNTGYTSKDGNSGKFIKPTNLEMDPRDTSYEDLEVPCLDDLLKKPEYDKLKEIFHKGVDGEDEDDHDNDNKEPEKKVEPVRATKPEPTKVASPPPKVETEEEDDDDDDDDDEDDGIKVGCKVKHAKYGVCSVLDVGSDGKLKIQDKEKNTHRAIKKSEVELFVEEKKPDIQSLKKPKTVKDEDDEEEE